MIPALDPDLIDKTGPGGHAERPAGRLRRWEPARWAVASDWRALLDDFFTGPVGRRLAAFMQGRLDAGAVVYPPQPLRALELTARAAVRVVILGQDPYHGAGQAEGLAFSVAPGVRLPPSLRNIFEELRRDLGTPPPADGSLARWARQGVLLLNTCLTVEEARPASHAGQGWEVLTDQIVEAVAARPDPYLDAVKTLQAELGLTGKVTLELLLSRADLFDLEGEGPGEADADWPAVKTALEGATNALAEMRQAEGKALEAALLGHLELVEATLATIAARAPDVVHNYKSRLELRLQRLLEGKPVDPGRFEQEVAILAERSDIAEETTRVTSHLQQFRDLIRQQGPHGRRMEFLLQEMQREANTIGAKANDAKTSHDVITLKSILEQLREQVQNVE